MLYACVERFDVIDERENILGWDGPNTNEKEEERPGPRRRTTSVVRDTCDRVQSPSMITHICSSAPDSGRV
jgi:hypothetical protein